MSKLKNQIHLTSKGMIGLFFLAASLFGSTAIMATEPEQSMCMMKSGQGFKVFDKCKTGDVLHFLEFDFIEYPYPKGGESDA